MNNEKTPKYKPGGQGNTDTTITTRCGIRDKEAFISVCKNQDSDASKEIRKFMKRYIAQYGQTQLTSGESKK